MQFLRKHHIKFLCLAIGFLAGWLLFSGQKVPENKEEAQQVREGGKFKFINPLVECEVGGADFLKKYVPFEPVAKKLISEITQQHPGIHLSIYFRNLNNGPWFGINENEDFAPASLLKLPLTMAYFKESEVKPGILSESVSYEESMLGGITQSIKPDSQIEVGKSYTVDELIRRMIVFSDNEAMRLLMERFPREKLYQIYSDMGITNPYSGSVEDVISVRDYSSFFRLLYNAAYLNRENSEKVLQLLSQVDYKDALVAGVPGNVTVAHKFGERNLEGEEFPVQRHDCGIVYYKKYPYLLCVMTRGKKAEDLPAIISRVSRIVYEEVSRAYP
jgi:beta-lactamase class A